MAKETINRNGRKTGEAVAATIRRRIANGELAVGDRLPTEDELTEAFGIARTTLREALRILEFQGLIHIRRGRGGGATVTMPDLVRLAEPLAVVLQLRKTTTADLDAARVLMEPHLAAELALHHTDEDLAALRAVLAKASAAAEAADADAFGSAAAELHVTLIQRGGNETLSVLSQLLNELILEPLHDRRPQVRPGAAAACRALVPAAVRVHRGRRCRQGGHSLGEADAVGQRVDGQG